MLNVVNAAPQLVGVREPALRSIDARRGMGSDEPDERFVRLLRDCRPYGGLARQTELEAHRALVAHVDRLNPYSPVRIAWGGIFWLPVFQFVPSTLVPRAACELVVAELADVYDEWRLAEWFVQPNEWLDQVCPVVRINDTAALRAAARADRFVALG